MVNARCLKIATIVGARPQFVKAALVSRKLRSAAREVLIHTGQHYDENMSGIFFQQLSIPEPEYNLEVGSGLHGEQTGEILKRVEPVLLREKPDWVLVYGDTNSTLAGALAGAKLHIPVAHVEAGLRSFNRVMPEEINRVLVDHLATVLFAPTPEAVTNLQREGISRGVYQVGDVMYEAVVEYRKIADEQSTVLQRLGLSDRKYALATVHRAENADVASRLTAILDGLETVCSDLPVVFPVHPRTRSAIPKLAHPWPTDLIFTEPLSYLDMIRLESQAEVIITDSGGVQKEAFFFRVPCVTVRDETEWVETVSLGWNTLAGADTGRIIQAVRNRRPGRDGGSPYGRGDASGRIVRYVFTHPIISHAGEKLDIPDPRGVEDCILEAGSGSLNPSYVEGGGSYEKDRAV